MTRPAKKPAQRLPDRFDLYERFVQAPHAIARLLAALHAGNPRILREDFSGAGAICRAWVEATGRTAIAVDSDAEPLKRLAGVPGITRVRADVLSCERRADIIASLNFPLGYFHERAELLRYLRRTRQRLRPWGVFVADLYGGRSAFSAGVQSVRARLPGGLRVHYQWEQRDADALTGLVHNAIHFSLSRPGLKREIRNAFTYHWRLWSIPELTDALREAGFRRVEVHDQQGGALDHTGRLHTRPVQHSDELADDWVVYIAARP